VEKRVPTEKLEALPFRSRELERSRTPAPHRAQAGNQLNISGNARTRTRQGHLYKKSRTRRARPHALENARAPKRDTARLGNLSREKAFCGTGPKSAETRTRDAGSEIGSEIVKGDSHSNAKDEHLAVTRARTSKTQHIPLTAQVEVEVGVKDTKQAVQSATRKTDTTRKTKKAKKMRN